MMCLAVKKTSESDMQAVTVSRHYRVLVLSSSGHGQ